MKPIFAFVLLLLSLISLWENGEAMRFSRICGSPRCRGSRSRVRSQCRRNRFVRLSCNIRRCRGRRWRCVPSSTSPTPSQTPSPSTTATASPSITPTSSPTPSTTPSPSISARPIPTQATGYTWGDPHIVTYDDARYDCQAAGEFILTKSIGSIAPTSCSSFEVHGRFRSVPNRAFTLSSGIAATEDNAPVVQFSINTDGAQPGMTIQGCSVVSFVNGVLQNFSEGDTMIGSEENTVVTRTGSALTAHFPTGMRVHVTVNRGLGCFFGNMVVTIPGLTIAKCQIVGLFGTPNERRDDEFTDRNGNTLPIIRQLRGREATNFCVNNFAISSESMSLFDFEAGDEFESAAAANLLTVEGPAVGAAPQNIRAVCGENEECLIDGILVGEDFARATLEDESGAQALAAEDIFMPVAPTDAPARFIDTSKVFKKAYGSFYSS